MHAKNPPFFSYGIPVLAGMDHKPLVAITEKGFAGRSPRLQIWYDSQLKYTEQSYTEQAFCPDLSTGLNLYRNRVLCACKNCLEFFSFQTGCHSGDLSMQKAKILDQKLQKVIQAISLTNWTALTGAWAI